MSFIVGDESYAFRTCKMLHNAANDFALPFNSTENTYGGLKTSYVVAKTNVTSFEKGFSSSMYSIERFLKNVTVWPNCVPMRLYTPSPR